MITEGQRAIRAIATTLALAVSLAGCAVSPERFEKKKYRMDDTQVCEAVQDAAKHADPSFATSVASEMERRRLDEDRCKLLISDKRKKIAIAVVAAVALTALAVAASKGGGGGGGSYQQPYAAQSDYSWQWDQFYNANRQLVWACRGEQSGQFAELHRCNGKVKSDWRWPGFEAIR